MKKVINIVISIIAVLIAFSLLTMLFMPKYIDENIDGRITAEYYREKTPIDVIFTGSSTVQAGVSPLTLYREYGITAYNRSNSSQVVPISYAMISDSFRRNKPELVVLDVGFLYQSDDYVDEGSSRKSLDAMRWSKAKSDCIKDVMDPTEKFIDYIFPILRFHSRWNDLKLEDFKYIIYKPTVTCNGQLLQFETIEDDVENNPYKLDDGMLATDRTMVYLQNIVGICRENGVQLFLMKMPVIAGNWNSGIDEQMKEFAEANGLNYVNFIDDFESIGLNKNTDFSDVQHMNSIGAEKFTKYLGEYIINNYTVSDRTKDVSIKKIFDKKLDRYESMMEERKSSEK